MDTLDLDSPFSGPVYRIQTCPSTMGILRELADHGAAHGTAVIADEQTAGRGRMAGRRWETGAPGENLAMSLLWADTAPLPAALPLRTGLASLLAIEAAFPRLAGRLALKWPNDLLVDVRDLPAAFPPSDAEPLPGWRKICGILCEGSFDRVFIGLGVNLASRSFKGALEHKASSVAAVEEALGAPPYEEPQAHRNRLAKALLASLKRCLGPGYPWVREIGERLWKKGERIVIEEGMAGSGRILEAFLLGLAADGSLRVGLDGGERLIACGEFREGQDWRQEACR